MVGYEPNERGEDAAALGEVLAAATGAKADRVHVEKGSPSKVLFRLAEEGSADLIVLGSTHRASLGRVTPGSVAEHLLNGSRCRLAIAPRGYARALAVLSAENAGEEADDVPARSPLPAVREQPRVVGVGFNRTAEAASALGEAAALADRLDATMRLIAVDLPVVSEVGPHRSGGGHLQAPLHDAAAQLPSKLRALPVHLVGDPAEQLLARAEEGMDLLVLGSRGFGPVMRLMLGSVSAQVIRKAPCPVLVTPRPPATPPEA